MPDLVDTSALHHAVEQLAQVVASLANEAGDAPAVRRLQNDVERLQIDISDCSGLRSLAPPPARQLEVIPDVPYDPSLWQGVDDEGLGGFHQAAKPHTRPRSHR
jgi:hypothetical protein